MKTKKSVMSSTIQPMKILHNLSHALNLDFGPSCRCRFWQTPKPLNVLLQLESIAHITQNGSKLHAMDTQNLEKNHTKNSYIWNINVLGDFRQKQHYSSILNGISWLHQPPSGTTYVMGSEKSVVYHLSPVSSPCRTTMEANRREDAIPRNAPSRKQIMRTQIRFEQS